jgi:hypothetical protein
MSENPALLMLQILHVSGFSEFPEPSVFEKDLL